MSTCTICALLGYLLYDRICDELAPLEEAKARASTLGAPDGCGNPRRRRTAKGIQRVRGRNPLRTITDTGSHGPFDRYRVLGRGVV